MAGEPAESADTSGKSQTSAAPSLAVPSARLLQNWKEAQARAVAYLDALRVPPEKQEELAAQAVESALASDSWSGDSDAVAETFAALRRLLPRQYPPPPEAAPATEDEFLGWRLWGKLSGQFANGGTSRGAAAPLPVRDGAQLCAVPPLNRRSMVPARVERRVFRRLLRRLLGSRVAASVADELPLRRGRSGQPWARVARRRRLLLGFLVLIPSIIASQFMIEVLPQKGNSALEIVIALFFAALFGWISIGFWTALMGFFLLIGRPDRFAITHLDGEEVGELGPEARTAIVMPIAQEPVDRVFAGLRAIYESLRRTGQLEHFDFFVLSDTGDPAVWIREEEAWADWCRDVGGFERIFYRRRKVRLKRKSGNVADFCRRWGPRYRYMVMLDADSVMSGDCIVRLAQLMEKHAGVGMIQTAPISVNRRSLFARVQQFAGRIYSPMFAAGLHFWQLGEGQYWGHNAIIRIKPFADHCGLAPLPGKPPLGGEILSHDFVEAALLGRAGWTLWLAYHLPGSYEETPSTLLEEMKRDRRWCQGNLQHLRLVPTEGFFGAHRALFLNGIMSYVSALLWLCFLILSTAEAIINALRPPEYFPTAHRLFPLWPVWRPDWALALLAVTGMILFVPKILSVLLIVFKGRNARAYGGAIRLSLSAFLEVLLSSLFAPIRMLFHSKFVIQNLLGRTVSWRSQGRGDAETGWLEAIRHHGLDTVFATAWGTTLYLLNPDYFWWVTPIIGALILSIPLSVLASRVSLGERARAWGLFLIPEETEPPLELRDLEVNLQRAQQHSEALPHAELDGFVRAAVDPYVNALHQALLGPPRRLRPRIREQRQALLRRAIAEGPASLGLRERQIVLSDAELVQRLHASLWRLPDRQLAARWGRPGGGR